MRAARGFTLIELVAVMVVLAILGGSVVGFLRSSIGIYSDSARRDNLTQIARFAIERVSRELRQALPGSLRVSGNCIEFAPVVAGSSYLGNVADGSYSSFQATDFSYSAGAADRVAIFAIEPRDVYIYSRRAVVDLAAVGAALGGQRTVMLANFLPPGHRFRLESPSRRFYLIAQPVSFCLRGNALYRHDSYGWLHPQSDSVADLGSGDLLAEHIQLDDGAVVTPFRFTPGSLQRAAMVHLDFRFSDPGQSDEWLRFSQEVFVRNVP